MGLNQLQSVSILCDLALAMAGETRPRPLATLMLQQMLWHTGCACGLVLKDDEAPGDPGRASRPPALPSKRVWSPAAGPLSFGLARP